MPTIVCANCGNYTNTSCSNHLSPVRADGKANKCYCYYLNGQWRKGCGWNELSNMEKQLYTTLLPREPL